MRVILLLILALILIGGGLKIAGTRLPVIDYPVGPIGAEGGPGMPDVNIEAPGFDDTQSLP